MLSSGGVQNELLTTSGIILWKMIMVISTLPWRVTVFHWAANQFITQMQMAHYLAESMTHLTDSDIALLRIPSYQGFHNETLGARLPDGANILPQKICGIRDPFDIRRYDEVTMNNPFSGYCIGVHVGVQRSKIPIDDPVVEHRWVTNEWIYFGNGLDEPMNGCCGSPILATWSASFGF